eukprot:TRINITY_DN2803_c0_g1_i10.p1 TRINITY_DN2803_c0_g1~~TRINITY_DN2803_c0_g1_i10.p1  ORF type:complete len:421 (-),score=122.49 TRINITY_DN2803_c0_g1_i10:87-1349(-)
MWKYGAPRRWMSDRGTNFKAELIRELMKDWNVEEVNIPAYSQNINGTCERAIGTIKEELKKYSEEWDVRLNEIVFNINNTVSTTTKKKPSELFLGRDIRTKMSGYVEKLSGRWEKNKEENLDEATRNTEEVKEKMEEKKNKGKVTKYKQGDLVYVWANQRGMKNWKDKRWFGPVRVAQGNDEHEHVKIQETGRMYRWIHQKYLAKVQTRIPEWEPDLKGTLEISRPKQKSIAEEGAKEGRNSGVGSAPEEKETENNEERQGEEKEKKEGGERDESEGITEAIEKDEEEKKDKENEKKKPLEEEYEKEDRENREEKRRSENENCRKEEEVWREEEGEVRVKHRDIKEIVSEETLKDGQKIYRCKLEGLRGTKTIPAEDIRGDDPALSKWKAKRAREFGDNTDLYGMQSDKEMIAERKRVLS